MEAITAVVIFVFNVGTLIYSVCKEQVVRSAAVYQPEDTVIPSYRHQLHTIVQINILTLLAVFRLLIYSDHCF
jgi:hypothetical protein